jgi:hypothetical protein
MSRYSGENPTFTENCRIFVNFDRKEGRNSLFECINRGFVGNLKALFCRKFRRLCPPEKVTFRHCTLPPQRKSLPSGRRGDNNLFFITVNVLVCKGGGGVIIPMVKDCMDIYCNDPLTFNSL